MKHRDFFIIFILVVLMVYYVCIGVTNKKTLLKNGKKKSILNSKWSFIFDLGEVAILFLLSVVLFIQKQYIIATVFTVAFLEHILQIVFCYRQTLRIQHYITILIFVMTLWYAGETKCYWVIPLFIIGILLHVCSLYSQTSFVDKVCMKNKRLRTFHIKKMI
jgi:hypothetical protein